MAKPLNKVVCYCLMAFAFMAFGMLALGLARMSIGYEILLERVSGFLLAGGWMCLQFAALVWCRGQSKIDPDTRAFCMLLITVGLALFLKSFVQRLDLMVADICVMLSLVLAGAVAAFTLIAPAPSIPADTGRPSIPLES